MTPTQIQTLAISPALSLLPERMNSPAARVLLVAIGLQESRFTYRRQIRGPAHGYWQFERNGGVAGVLRHGASKAHIEHVCTTLDYPAKVRQCYEAIVHNDVLAAAFARCLLWTIPTPLPSDADGGWRDYLAAWRPGKPHPESWPACWQRAQETVA